MEEEKDTIVHFSHPHPLKLSITPASWWTRCSICSQDSEGEFYKCFPCSYRLHPLCAKYPEKMIHPFHPHHTLCFGEFKWCTGKDNRCHACQGDFNGRFAYLCTQCYYVLHLKCSVLTPVDKIAEEKLSGVTHQHSLLVCENPQSNLLGYDCHICKEGFRNFDLIYACIECSWLMHKICVRLQNEIRHPFHLEHPLTLTDFLHEKEECDACGRGYRISGKYMYQCQICYFTLGVHCAATLMPISNSQLSKQVHFVQSLNQLEPHALVECASINNFMRSCSLCDQPFEENSIHVCLKCSVVIDKTCFELPQHISHPFHPQHSLVLGRWYSSCCIGCRKMTGSFSYKCKECIIFLDIKCARTKIECIPSMIHKHDLAYFYFEVRGVKCIICWKGCDKFFFGCVDCNFYVHDHCYSELPQTIKHECHCDPLTLNCSPIKDYSDQEENEAEFYCAACEDLRQYDHPTYYCAECHYVAHVHCVISEIIQYLQALFKPLAQHETSKAKAPVTYNSDSEDDFKDNGAEAIVDDDNDFKDKGAEAIVYADSHTDEHDSNKIDDPLVSDEKDVEILLLQKEVDEIAAEMSKLEAEMSKITSMLHDLKQRHSASTVSLQKKLLDRNSQKEKE